jgi:thiamine biosynthesis protein ThiS
MAGAPFLQGTNSIRLNGETRSVPTGCTLSDLLRDLGIDPRMIVVERNREILRDRNAFDEVTLEDSDVLELVHFVGGG